MIKRNKNTKVRVIHGRSELIKFHKLSREEQTALIRSLPVCVDRHEAEIPTLLLATNIRYHTIARMGESKIVIRYNYGGKQRDYFLGSVIGDDKISLDGVIDFNYEFFALYYFGRFDMDWLSECICDIDCDFMYK